LDRIARLRVLDLLAAIVEEAAHAPVGVAGHDRVSDAQGAALDEHRRNRAATRLEAGLDDRPRRLALRVRGQHELDVRDEADAHGDVGALGAARAHGGEGLWARRVEERDPAAVAVAVIGADVPGAPAGLALDARGLADRVEEGRLAVVDVAHDRHYRRARREI